MKERPILFSAPMVRALLDGSKTQTRRIMKPQPVPIPGEPGKHWWSSNAAQSMLRVEDGFQTHPGIFDDACPHGRPGDRIWVRETWRSTGDGGRADYMAPRDMQPHQVWYDADGAALESECTGKTRTSIHMPRWASRILLEVTGVRVERLQDISDADIEAEGIDMEALLAAQDSYDIIAKDGNATGRPTLHSAWRNLWESTGGDWDANPWLWVIEFKRVTP